MMGRLARATALAGMALVLVGCSQDEEQKPACGAAYSDAAGGCGNGAVAGAIELAEGGPESRTTVTLWRDGSDNFGNSGEGSRDFVVGRVPPGLYSLVVQARGYATMTKERVRVSPGATTKIGTIRLETRRPSIVGTVSLQRASDHRGTLVSLDDQSQVIGTAQDGSFRIDDVEPGAHVLHLRHPGYESVDTEVVVPEYDDLPFAYELERLPPSGTLAGSVTRADTGAPLEGVTIRVGDEYSTATGSDGVYMVSGILVGRYQVTATLAGFGRSVAAGVEIRAGEETSFDFQLREDAPYGGRVMGSASRMHGPVGENGGIVVRLEQLGRTATTDADGSWELEDVPPGTYDFTFDDARFPAVRLSGVVTKEGEDLRVPEVVLGPAKKIADRLSSYSHVFPANRKALLLFPTDPATYLYDRIGETLKRVWDESLTVIAVDAEEQFATLKGSTTLFRLDITTGAIEPVEGPAFGSLVSDRALTLYVADDGKLYEVKAGWSIAMQREQLMPSTLLSFGATIDEARGWRVVKLHAARDLEMAVDFQGWALPAGDQVLFGSSPEIVLTVGVLYPNPGGAFRRTLHWTNLHSRLTIEVTDTLGEWRLAADKRGLLFAHAPANDKWSISSMTVGTGELMWRETNLDSDFAWLSSTSLVAKRSGQTLWISPGFPSSGILCGDSPEEVFRTPFYGCLDGTGPARTLRVFDDSSRTAQTYSTNATAAWVTNLGLVSWTDSGGQLHVRTPWSPVDLAIDCANPVLQLIGDRSVSVLAQCDATSFILDYWSGRVLSLGDRANACRQSPDGEHALCSYPCASGTCAFLHDFGGGTSTQVASSSSAIESWWGRDGGLGILSDEGAFHVKPGMAGEPPVVVDCGIEVVSLGGIGADHSVWFDPENDLAYVCSSDGSVSDPFSAWTGSARVGQSTRVFVGGWLVDLADGSHVQVTSARPDVAPFFRGLLVASDEGLVWIPENGAPEWLVTGAEVERITYRGRVAFEVGRSEGHDLLVADADGAVQTVVEGVVDSRRSGEREVFLQGAGSLTSVSGASLDTWTLPFPVSTGDPWLLSGDRLFFHTPTESGVAFVGADLAQKTSSILHESGGHAIGPGRKGRWLFAADGWSWEETAGAPRAVLAAEIDEVQTVAGSSFVFHAPSPDVTYWLDSD